MATLHTEPGTGDIFDDAADQVALYDGVLHQVYLPAVLNALGTNSLSQNRPANQHKVALPAELPVHVVGFFAWGSEPTGDESLAVSSGVWAEGMYKEILLPGEPPTLRISRGESLGLVPGSQTMYADNFTIYGTDQVTQGGTNPIPNVIPHTYAGNILDSETFALSWYPVEMATSYQIQLDDKSDFDSQKWT